MFPHNDPRLIKLLQQSHRLGQEWITDEDFQKQHLDDKDWVENEMDESGELYGNMFMIHGVRRDGGGDKVLMPVVFASWPPPATMNFWFGYFAARGYEE